MKTYKITVGYYQETRDYLIEAPCVFDAKYKGLSWARQYFHSKAEIVGVECLTAQRCPHCGEALNNMAE